MKVTPLWKKGGTLSIRSLLVLVVVLLQVMSAAAIWGDIADFFSGGWGEFLEDMRRLQRCAEDPLDCAEDALDAVEEVIVEEVIAPAVTEVVETASTVYANAQTAVIATQDTFASLDDASLYAGPLLAGATKLADMGSAVKGFGEEIGELAEDAYDTLEDILDIFECFGGDIEACIPGIAEVRQTLEFIWGVAEVVVDTLMSAFETLADGLLAFFEEFIDNLSQVFSMGGSGTFEVPDLGFITTILELVGLELPDIPVKFPRIDFGALDPRMFDKLLKAIIRAFAELASNGMDDLYNLLTSDEERRRKLLRSLGAESVADEVLSTDLCFAITISKKFGSYPKFKYWAPEVEVLYCYNQVEPYVEVKQKYGKFESIELAPPTKKISFSIVVNKKAFGVGLVPGPGSLGDVLIGHNVDVQEVRCLATSFPTGVTLPHGEKISIDVEGGVSMGLSGISASFEVGGSVDIFSIPKLPSGTPLTLGYSKLTVPTSVFGGNSAIGGAIGTVIDSTETLEEAGSEDSHNTWELIAMTNPVPNKQSIVVMIKSRDNKCLQNNFLRNCDTSNEEQFWVLDGKHLRNLHHRKCLTSWSCCDTTHLMECGEQGSKQDWEFTPEGYLYNPSKGKCFDAATRQMASCQAGDSRQFFWVTTNSMWAVATRAYGLKSKHLWCLAKDPDTSGTYLLRIRYCNGNGNQQLAMDSSSRVYSSFQEGGHVLSRRRSDSQMYFFGGVGDHGNQFFTINENGYLLTGDTGECLSRRGGIFFYLDLVLGPCKPFDRRTLVSSDSFKKLLNQEGKCLSVHSDDNVRALTDGCSYGSSQHRLKLQNGRLQNGQGKCVVVNSNNHAITRSCSSDQVTNFHWSYDPDAFWIYYIDSNDVQRCLASSSGLAKVETCQTRPSHQWGDHAVFGDSSVTSEFYFTGLPFQIRVLSRLVTHCLTRPSSSNTVEFEDCATDGSDNWVYKKETGHLVFSETNQCLQLNGDVGTCDTGNSEQKWTYNRETLYLTAENAEGETQCFYIGNGSNHDNENKGVPCDSDAIPFKDQILFGPKTLPLPLRMERPPRRLIAQRIDGSETESCAKATNFQTIGNVKYADVAVGSCGGSDAVDEVFFLASDGLLRHATVHGNQYVLRVAGVYEEADFVDAGDLNEDSHQYFKWKYDQSSLKIRSDVNPELCLDVYNGKMVMNWCVNTEYRWLI